MILMRAVIKAKKKREKKTKGWSKLEREGEAHAILD